MKQNFTPPLAQNFCAKYYITFIAIIMTGLFLWHATKAADTDTIAATVSATNLAVSVSDGTIAFGSVALNTSTTTANNGYTQVVTNDGSDAQMNVKSSDATGGTTWTVETAVGSDQFKLEVSTTTGASYMTIQGDDVYLTASSSMTSLLTDNLDFQLTTPTASTDFVQKSITITVQVASI